MSEGRTITIDGLPMASAPPFLTPYADCIDGITCISEPRGMPGSRWLLFRGGKLVGQVDAMWDDIPYSSGEPKPKMRRVL